MYERASGLGCTTGEVLLKRRFLWYVQPLVMFTSVVTVVLPTMRLMMIQLHWDRSPFAPPCYVIGDGRVCNPVYVLRWVCSLYVLTKCMQCATHWRSRIYEAQLLSAWWWWRVYGWCTYSWGDASGLGGRRQCTPDLIPSAEQHWLYCITNVITHHPSPITNVITRQTSKLQCSGPLLTKEAHTIWVDMGDSEGG